MKKAQHSEQWPWPVEVQHKSDVVHASLASETDQKTLMDMAGRAGTRTPTTPRVSGWGEEKATGEKRVISSLHICRMEVVIVKELIVCDL